YPVRDQAGRGMALRRRRAGGMRREAAAERHRPLRDAVDLRVAAEERRRDEGSALERLGVAERRRDRVEPRALARDRRQGRGPEHGGDVLHLQLARVHVEHDPAALEQVQHALRREQRLLRVPRAREPDDEPVARELVRPHALDGRDVLEPRAPYGRGEQQQEAGGAHQKGHIQSNRRWTSGVPVGSLTMPTPWYITRASARRVDGTELSVATSSGRTVPESSITWFSPFNVTTLLPRTCRLPLGSTA